MSRGEFRRDLHRDVGVFCLTLNHFQCTFRVEAMTMHARARTLSYCSKRIERKEFIPLTVGGQFLAPVNRKSL